MDSSPPAANLRSKTRRAVAEERNAMDSTSSPASRTADPNSSSFSVPATRNNPYLPTPAETLLYAVFPALLLFGTIFSLLSPQVRRAEYDPVLQAHAQDPSEAPSYFARKSNIFNVFFVKKGWLWVSVSFATFVLTHPVFAPSSSAATAAVSRAKALIRWGLITGFWFVTTQWCFGPPLIDRSFRWTGGKCEIVEELVEEGNADAGDKVSAVACKAVGGVWKGGHDISGHVFLLVLGSGFLLQEVAWVVLRRRGAAEERTVVMGDGAVKNARVEAAVSAGGSGERASFQEDSLGVGGRFVAGVVALSCWMLLMTAIYFHTWFEKFTGLATATTALYAVYVLPRFVPAVRQQVGIPGV